MGGAEIFCPPPLAHLGSPATRVSHLFFRLLVMNLAHEKIDERSTILQEVLMKSLLSYSTVALNLFYYLFSRVREKKAWISAFTG